MNLSNRTSTSHDQRLQVIDDLIAWKLRKPYWELLVSGEAPLDKEWLMKHFTKRWMEIHGRRSPKGQLPQMVTGSIDSNLKAQHLAVAYNSVVYAAHRTISPKLTPVFDYMALHRGYTFYLETLRGGIREPLISVERLYRALMDAHEYLKCKERGSTWPGAIPVYCSNRRTCGLNGMLFLFSPSKTSMHACPFCGCSPALEDDYAGTQAWREG